MKAVHADQRILLAAVSPVMGRPRRQSVACESVWLAHMGGARLEGPAEFGSRREFIVLGGALRRAGEALDEAPAGAVAVAADAWPFLAGSCAGEPTPNGKNQLWSAEPPSLPGVC